MYLNIKDLDKNAPNISLSIQIWDASREERYTTIAGHIRGPDREYLVNDITSEMSFKYLNYWYKNIKISADKDIMIYLIGNKSDLIYEQGRMRKKLKKDWRLWKHK